MCGVRFKAEDRLDATQDLEKDSYLSQGLFVDTLTGMARRRRVLIDEEYLAFLHDQLAENQAKLKEILHNSGAETIYGASADRLVQTVVKDFTFHPIDGVLEKFESWGLKVSKKNRGGSVEVQLECPYAETVHPRLSSKEPVCPLNEYVLGALRLEYDGATMKHNSLLKGGAKFVITTKKPS
jgi:hypothetical protein